MDCDFTLSDPTHAATRGYDLCRYLDEVLEMQRGGASHFFHCDDIHNVVAITDYHDAYVEVLAAGWEWIEMSQLPEWW